MDFIDTKYINLISNRLPKFKKVKKDLYNFRCPLCGDSHHNKNKARGYFYSMKNNTNFKCHNCGMSISFNNFLKSFDSVLHQEYIYEKFKDGRTGKNFVITPPKIVSKTPVFKNKVNLPKASENPDAKKYLEDRKIDSDQFYFAKEFKTWANTQKETFSETFPDESRIIIPMYDRNKTLIGFQGRSIGVSRNKYITVMISENSPKIYGLDKINPNQRVYVVEGPFDSTFIPNCIAMCGSDVNLSSLNLEDYVYIFDNEPRNTEIVNRISKVIDKGDKVVIWPPNIIKKDINELILTNMTSDEIMETIENNTYSGLIAKLKFNHWKRC